MVDIDINVKMVLIPADAGSMHAYNYHLSYHNHNHKMMDDILTLPLPHHKNSMNGRRPKWRVASAE